MTKVGRGIKIALLALIGFLALTITVPVAASATTLGSDTGAVALMATWHAYDQAEQQVLPPVALAGLVREATARSQRDSDLISGFGVAAEAGPRALPVGPWGQKVVDARDRLPSSWGPGNPNAKGVGTRWSDPSAPQTSGLRLDQGIPGSGWPSQQVDHVVVRSGGRILGPDGKPIVGSLRENPQAHIPLSDWRNWSSWNAP